MQHTTTNEKSMLRLLRGIIPNRQIGQHEHRRIAELQANKLRSYLGVAGSMLDSEKITQLPHLELRFDENLPTSGMSFWNGQTWVILLNPTEATTRQRFSLLHELHHIICHTKQSLLFGENAARNDPAAEQMADYFAACALMPKRHVKRLHGEGIHNAQRLAHHFNVSQVAMKYRLDQLGLHSFIPRCGFSRSSYRRQRRGFRT